jgi:hypothetical protein
MGVWQKIKKAMIPKGRQCVKHRLLFDIKHNGMFQPSLVACGCFQVQVLISQSCSS